MRSPVLTSGAEAACYGLLKQLDEEPVLAILRLPDGANSHIYKAISARRSRIVKVYSTTQADGYDRGGTEFRALQYLWSRGFRNVPQPLAFFPEDQVGVYSFEKGAVLRAHAVGVRDVEGMADFLTAVRDVMQDVKALFPPERTACLCLRAYLDRVQQRIDAIIRHEAPSRLHADVQRFVAREVLSRFDEASTDFVAHAAALQLDLDEPLPMEHQVLVPADMGIHNMLVDRGRHVFLDFEYFGRDDPCRTVLHVLHHDSHRQLSARCKAAFLQRVMARGLPAHEDEGRLRLIDPLVGFDWVLLYLNVCSAQGNTGRPPCPARVVRARLGKAQEKLHSLRHFEVACR